MRRLGGGVAVFALALTGLGGCGQDTGYLYERQTVQVPAEPGETFNFDAPEARHTGLTWLHDCSTSDQIARPAPTRGHLVLENAGPHPVVRERMFDVPVSIKGKVCAPRAYHRDIVFLIDVTGSTFLTDPMSGGTCRRFEAMNDVLRTLTPDDKVAAVTFAEVVVKDSPQLFDSRDELFAHLAGRANPTDAEVAAVVCSFGDVANYNDAFARAKALLETGRDAQTKKEIFLIADGFGNATIQQDQARQIRNEITTQGVTISGERIVASVATLYLENARVPGSGNGQFVHSFATADRAGAALSGNAVDATQVARSIGSIANNIIERNKVRIRPIGAPAWQEFDAMAHMSGHEFAIPSFPLPVDLVQTGFEMELEYFDTHNNRGFYVGRIEWAQPE